MSQKEKVDTPANKPGKKTAAELVKEIKTLQTTISDRDKAEAKEQDPMSGPGILCEVVEITPSEAWQLPMHERMSPISSTPEMISDPVPDGYVAKAGPSNTRYVVSPDDGELIPNCKSKYTKEYWVYTRKRAEDRGNFTKEPPKANLHLCEHHADIFSAHSLKEKKK